MTKRTILIDQERCTGCWTCAMVCHVANHLEEDEYRLHVETIGSGGIDEPSGEFPNLSMSWKPVYTKKCTLCADRIGEGLDPYCMRNCPSEALLHGDLDDEASAIRKRYDELMAKGRRVVKPFPWEDSRPEVIYLVKGE